VARDVAAGNVGAVERVRAQLPDVALPLTQRNAQLVIAREYGYAGWQDLAGEVSRRLGRGLEWAVREARRVIHDNDVERMKRLLVEYPALLAWQGDHDDGVLGFATDSYGDSFDPSSEEHFTRAACAELLIDAGAIVTPSVCDGLLKGRARGLLEFFRRKGLLPRTLKFFAALGDIDAVRTARDHDANDAAKLAAAFTIACSFEHEAMASLLLDRAIALDPDLGAHVDQDVGRQAFTKYFIDNRPEHAIDAGLWKAFVMEQVIRSVYSWRGSETSLKARRGESDLAAFVRLLNRESWLLGESCMKFQTEIIERATLVGRAEFMSALLDVNPAILRRQTPPQSLAIEFAFTFANTHMIPVLTRIWPLPEDLPHAAAMGDLSRVKRWFDESGAPALGDIDNHYPCTPYMPKARVEKYAQQWGPPSARRVLDAAFAWAVINDHFDVADFLLRHGADINTTWSSHEPASVLHELVWHRNYEAMQFLIDRGIDMTIRDYRWNATAQGWAFYAAKDEKLARWLETAARQREPESRR
jgi:ankyrin repeat protein